ncbi:MAG: glucokinase [Pseudomonadota bacterium]
MAEPILVADIGGTNARFAVAETEGGALTIRDTQKFRAVDFETVRDAAHAYCEAIGERPKRACFAAAGPIAGDEVRFTNSMWRVRRDEIEGPLGLQDFCLVNDFYALAKGIGFLPDDAFVSVKGGEPDKAAPTLVVGPGTGLGQALVIPMGDRSHVVSTEGGHVTFAPRTDEEFEVMRFIAREHPRVSVERLLSGRGLVNIHRALCVIAGKPRVSLQANEITAAAMDQSLPVAVDAVSMFCGLLGRVVGDAVLSTGARAGVVLGGGILPQIKDLFLSSRFVDLFIDKGRMSSYVDAVPVRLITAEGAALYGAAASMKDMMNEH